ncbi:hypothetical protein DSL92_07015 [Billgrantia gudaonensis]|uniref:Uncharacterized protein n=1 Tax=Billgrantia gudaonensis TaxID=376427 RepID=A0A3S0QRJ1_9GAMM|nr:hypothetical protein DSL92_07015 [Halomonas gudaonensis]
MKFGSHWEKRAAPSSYAGLNHLRRRSGPQLVDGVRHRPTIEAVRRGYPLSRSLYLYLNLPPDGALPAVSEPSWIWCCRRRIQTVMSH